MSSAREVTEASPDAIRANSQVSSAASVRRAKGGDYTDIMAIGDVYELADYLPHMFYRFLDGENYYMFVVVVDNEIVNFSAFHVPPGGATVNKMAGRTRSDVRRLGYNKLLTVHALREIRQLHPGVERCTRDAFYSRYWKGNLQKGIEESGTALHRVWKVFVYYCDRSVLESLPLALLKVMRELPTPTRLSGHHIDHALSSSSSSSSGEIESLLRRDGDYYVCWNNWMVLPCNTAAIKLGLGESLVFATYSSTSRSSLMTALSSSSWIPVTADRVRMDVYFYGDGVDQLYGHLRAHLEATLKEADDFRRCVLELHFPAGMDSAAIQKTLCAHLGELYFYTDPEAKVTECILVSEPLEKLIGDT